MDSILRSTVGTVTLEVRDADGVLIDADAAPTYAITDAAGTAVKSGTSVKRGATTGLYDVSLSATDTAALGDYRVAWTVVVSSSTSLPVTRYDVVGGHVFSLGDLRAFDRSLTSVTNYPAATLRFARDAAVERLERAMGVALTPRGAYEVLSGNGSTRLMLPHVATTALLSVTVDGTAWTAADVTVLPTGVLVAPEGWVWAEGDANVVVKYEHGMVTTPEPVRRAAMLLATEYAVPSALPARATSQSTESGYFRLSTADRSGLTGLPEVDAVIAEFGWRRPSTGANA